MVELKSTKEKEDSHEKAVKEAPKVEPAPPIDKAKELTEMCQRIQADFENYKKRSLKETEERRQQAKGELIAGLLPILDSFEMALKSKASPEEFRKGVELIYSQLIDMMRKEGLSPIAALGRKFDPYRHEALLTEATSKSEEDEHVVEELQKGYLLKDKVLRYAKVRILKKV
ncbi:MAG: nucleotide exchange factor GrpE [Nanoarchaeota archaeon]|nr:nucleotide exchange factor GrpE [Nanoarchaeota archaeon]